MKINKKEFKKLYNNCLQDILIVQPLDMKFKRKISLHEQAYLNFNFKYYLERSWIRCWNVYQLLPEISSKDKKIKLIDIGGFFGNFSLCLKRLGYDVSLAEVYDYYGDSFDNLRKFLEKEGVQIIDMDLTLPFKSDFDKQYDVILCLAILEHLANSPKALFENIKKILTKEGILLLEVPNLAYWLNRIKLLSGISILPSIETIYKSKIPFTGHHHEYVREEIVKLAQLNNLKLDQLVFYNYSLNSFVSKIKYFPVYIFNNCKEIMLARLKSM